MDVNLEAVVTKAIKQMSISRIIIAHRIGNILSADKIFALNCGQLTDVSQTIKQQYQNIDGEKMQKHTG